MTTLQQQIDARQAWSDKFMHEAKFFLAGALWATFIFLL